MRRLVAFTWQHYLQHPEFLTLLNSENLHRARHLKQSKRIREMNSPLIQTLGEVLERGRRDGMFRGGVDAVQLYISIAGLAYFYLSNHHTLSTIFGPKPRIASMCSRISASSHDKSRSSVCASSANCFAATCPICGMPSPQSKRSSVRPREFCMESHTFFALFSPMRSRFAIVSMLNV